MIMAAQAGLSVSQQNLSDNISEAVLAVVCQMLDGDDESSR